MAPTFRANKYAFFDSNGNLTAVSATVVPINIGVRPFRTVSTATDSATILDGIISWNYPFNVAKTQTIPSAAAMAAGTPLTIKDATGGAAHVPIIIAPPLGVSTIDGLASYPLFGPKASVTLVSDGVSNWEII